MTYVTATARNFAFYMYRRHTYMPLVDAFVKRFIYAFGTPAGVGILFVCFDIIFMYSMGYMNY